MVCREQCDQIGRFFKKVLVTNFLIKSSPTFWVILKNITFEEKMQLLCVTFGYFGQPFILPSVVDVIKLILPKAKAARIEYFKRTKQFLSISIVFTFLCRFRHGNKHFSVS